MVIDVVVNLFECDSTGMQKRQDTLNVMRREREAVRKKRRLWLERQKRIQGKNANVFLLARTNNLTVAHLRVLRGELQRRQSRQKEEKKQQLAQLGSLFSSPSSTSCFFQKQAIGSSFDPSKSPLFSPSPLKKPRQAPFSRISPQAPVQKSPAKVSVNGGRTKQKVEIKKSNASNKAATKESSDEYSEADEDYSDEVEASEEMEEADVDAPITEDENPGSEGADSYSEEDTQDKSNKQFENTPQEKRGHVSRGRATGEIVMAWKDRRTERDDEVSKQVGSRYSSVRSPKAPSRNKLPNIGTDASSAAFSTTMKASSPKRLSHIYGAPPFLDPALLSSARPAGPTTKSLNPNGKKFGERELPGEAAWETLGVIASRYVAPRAALTLKHGFKLVCSTVFLLPFFRAHFYYHCLGLAQSHHKCQHCFRSCTISSHSRKIATRA